MMDDGGWPVYGRMGVCCEWDFTGFCGVFREGFRGCFVGYPGCADA